MEAVHYCRAIIGPSICGSNTWEPHTTRIEKVTCQECLRMAGYPTEWESFVRELDKEEEAVKILRDEILKVAGSIEAQNKKERALLEK